MPRQESSVYLRQAAGAKQQAESTCRYEEGVILIVEGGGNTVVVRCSGFSPASQERAALLGIASR